MPVNESMFDQTPNFSSSIGVQISTSGASRLNCFFFPASFILKVKDHVFLFRYLPIGPGSTAAEWFMLIDEPPENEAQQKILEMNHTVFADVASQDAAISEAVQSGLAPGTSERFTFTRIEPAVWEFHRSINTVLPHAQATEGFAVT